MQFSVNQSPFAGREATVSSTSRQVRARLARELETNVALRVADGPTADIFEVSGRGELHLSILIETMRREGFEFEVSRPAVIMRDVDGHREEPFEECIIDCGLDAVGTITEALGSRGAQLQSMRTDAGSGARLTYLAPTRALIGLRRQMSLEECLDFIEDDELVEVTPKGIRMRKRELIASNRIKIRKREIS